MKLTLWITSPFNQLIDSNNSILSESENFENDVCGRC